MGEELQKFTAVSFDKSFSNITKGQQLLLDMLIKHLKEKIPISREDIINCYLDATMPSGTKEQYEYMLLETGSYGYTRVTRTKEEMSTYWSTRMRSIQWFRANLGSCIIKGRIIAIPVIEL